jgi:transposase-like protein
VLLDLIRIIINLTMQIERQNHLGDSPYERSPDHRDHANGYKPKTVVTPVSKITFDVPRVRESNLYPHSLENSLRSERTLKLILAEMFIQGVYTRKVDAITE